MSLVILYLYAAYYGLLCTYVLRDVTCENCFVASGFLVLFRSEVVDFAFVLGTLAWLGHCMSYGKPDGFISIGDCC